MKSYKKLLHIFIFIGLSIEIYGQFQIQEPYDDLDLYYSLIEKEQRDSTYAQALSEWEKNQTNIQTKLIPFIIHSNKLAAQYLSVILGPEKQADSKAQVSALMAIAVHASKKKEYALELDALSRAFKLAFWHAPTDYHQAFIISFILEELLPKVSDAEYPDKRSIYFDLGEAYYLFLDFNKSIEFLEHALSPSPNSFVDRANLDALKILGICYANIFDWEQSDRYFRMTLLSNDVVKDRPYYNAYAISHLGCNAMLTGQYDKALALSSAVWQTLRQKGDNGHLAGMCYCKGRSYLKKGEYEQARIWIDSLVYFATRDNYNKVKRIKQTYSLRAEYYAAMGDISKSHAYHDTLVNIYKKEEADLTSQYIVRAAQDYHNAKISAQDSQLKKNRTKLIFVSVLVILSTLAIIIITCLYRRNRAAYKALIQKVQQWASDNNPPPNNSFTDIQKEDKTKSKKITPEDQDIMARVNKEMTEKYAYREAGLTAEMLADRLGIHRNSLSRAVNGIYGSNFNQYVNAFRIKEAVRIMTRTSHKELYIDELYEQVGFSNRTSFYRVFKQITGISPREFKKNR